ncbi:hypothetical protein [Bacillus sp. SM2101]|uniref:hypothetical protein n=1 Tax=Bacillus sp. SM2101 TaxID=2805366 RepID=UPI001BDDE3AE|nr:hypothetical protein [Bacillus sp. SM2101]
MNHISTKTSNTLLVFSLIIIFSSFIIPILIVGMIQPLMINYDQGYWYYSANITAYLWIFIATIFLGLGLILYYTLERKFGDTIKIKIVSSLIVLISIACFLFGMNDYTYMTHDTIKFNAPLSMKEKEYKWDEVTKAQLIYNNDGVRVLHLAYENELEFEIDARKYYKNGILIRKILDRNGIKVEYPS